MKLENMAADKSDAIVNFGKPESKGRKVFIKCVFLKIEDINTIQETFSGLCFVRARWRESSLDGAKGKDPSSVNYNSLWNPKLDVNNILGEAKEQIWHDIQFNDNGECYILEKRRIKGTFTEKMELEEFPFDIQDLSLLVTSELSEQEINMLEDEEDISNVVTHSFVDESEWHLKKFVQCTPRITENEFTQNKYKKPGLFFRCCVIRRAGFFLWNIMLVMSIISALSFVTFSVVRTKPENRIQLSFILLLAGVTFKFAASQSVPKISYLTHLDRYILGSMVFLFLVAVHHGFITRISDSDLSATIDLYVFIGFIGLYILLHVIFFVTMIIRGHSRRKDVHLREQEYLAAYKKRLLASGAPVPKEPKKATMMNSMLGVIGLGKGKNQGKVEAQD